MGVAEDFERCIAGGGIAVFPADTVYGLACDPANAAAVSRLYALKGRPPGQAGGDHVDFSVAALPRPAAPHRRRRARAAPRAADRSLVVGPLGLRVPDLPLLAGVTVPVLQTSANHSGAPDARRLEDVPADIRAGADLVIDGGELPGAPSTVVDLTAYEDDGAWSVLREGAVPRATLAAVL